jgi:hypothetical protein
LKTSGCHPTWPSLLQKIENYCQKHILKFGRKPVATKLYGNDAYMIHFYPGRLWKMAAIVTKNWFFWFLALLPSLSYVVRRKLFQKSSPLKVIDQWKPNFVWIITRVSSFNIVSGDAVHQPTWPLLLKIEHMVKLQVFGNNSKTVNNIKNLIWGKNDQHIKIYLPCNFEVNLITHLGVIALFSSNL